MMTPMPDADARLATLGRLIRQRRDIGLHLTALEAARRANVARQTWADVEAGKTRSQRGTYSKIETLLGWPQSSCLDYLNGGAEPSEIGDKTVQSLEARRLLSMAATNTKLTEDEQARLVRIGLEEWDKLYGETDDKSEAED
jgi:transcriptional regulator with XRE-family HTH domain